MECDKTDLEELTRRLLQAFRTEWSTGGSRVGQAWMDVVDMQEAVMSGVRKRKK